MMKRILTYEYCEEVALKCENREELFKIDSGVYQKIYKNKWNHLFEHMSRTNLPAGYWTYERCKEASLKLNYKSEFKEKYPSIFIPAKRNGWWDEITSHMDRKPLESMYDSMSIIDTVKNFKSRNDLFENGKGLYGYIKRKNLTHIIDEVFPSIQVENKKLHLENKRKCNKCEKILDLTNYDLCSTKNVKKGYRSRCKNCFKDKQKKYWESVRESKLKENGLIKKRILWSEGKKKCTVCNEIKDINLDFYKNPKNGKVESNCKNCVSKQNKLRNKENGTSWKLSLRNEGKKWCNRCQSIKLLDEFPNKKNNKIDGKSVFCKECKAKTDKEYRENPKYKEIQLLKKKEYYIRTKDTDRHKANQLRSKEKRDYKVEYKRTMSDEFKRFKSRIRGRVNAYFKINKDWVKKDTKTIELLGADYFVVKEFIERQFLRGMTWDNYGTEWHIDHVIPLDAADKDYEKVKRLCYYQNLSPMWGNDNLKKGSKIPNICTFYENPIVPYKEKDIVIIPKHDGFVGRYKLRINVGTRFGNLTVISDDELSKPSTNNWDRRVVKVKCDCGVIKEISLNSLRLGTTKSCGCLQKILSLEYQHKHRKLLFTNEELKIIVEYVKVHPKNRRTPIEFIKKFQGRTKEQILKVIRDVRNNTMKRLQHL